ncbi:MAG TPA: hypothetical protein VHX44_03495 [Planctomycetota bacterium]|jgi:hypothetical protein|nr:hypothetical protein [Planctomycetota bacterium]
MSLATIGAELHADPDFAKACLVTLPGAAAVETTVRAQNSQATDPQDRAKRSDRLSCFLYLLTSAVSRPPKATQVQITDATSPYFGTWQTAEAAEPTGHGEWRCAAVLVTTTNAMVASAGSPRPPTIP